MMAQERMAYGTIAEFDTPEAILRAARAAYEKGYRKMDAFTPFPVEGLPEAIGFRRNRMPLLVLAGGLGGAGLAYWFMWYINVVAYPLNVGGRPHHSWPAFIPITFESAVLFAALAALIGFLVLNGLPQPHHPVFDASNFERASQDRFFLLVETDDPLYRQDETRHVLEALGALNVSEVPRRST